MNAMTLVTLQAEQPGRLQLAIIGWQRQLIAKREAQKGEPMLDAGERERAAGSA